MINTKEELWENLWKVANRLKESIDPWDFKNYILGFLFYRYLSEGFEIHINKKTSKPDFHYSECSDDAPWIKGLKRDWIEEKGYFLYPSQLFKNLLSRTMEDYRNLNEDLGVIFDSLDESTKLSESKGDFWGLFQLIDLNNSHLGEEVLQRNNKLRDILLEISKLKIDVSESSDESIKFGETFEFLIQKYVSTILKTGDEFYTPNDVSELVSRLISLDKKNEIKKVYDPACGYGCLLNSFRRHIENNENIEFFGQEVNPTTFNLCRMNMILNGINYSKFEIKKGDTLIDDKFPNLKFDTIISYLPSSVEWEGDGNINIRNDERFLNYGGIAPRDSSDLAFIQHILYHLEDYGIAVVICLRSVLSEEGSKKKNIRRFLVENNFIDAVINLPSRIFYKTNRKFCIVILKKIKVSSKILFIEGSEEFEKSKSRDRLSHENIQNIVNLYNNRKDIEHYSKVADESEISSRRYRLAPDFYIDSKDLKKIIDIDSINSSIYKLTKKIDYLKKEIDDFIKNL